MSQEIGIYRGSFDPPHKGHLEVVTQSLKRGLSRLFVVYKDINPFKPFRSKDEDRKALLTELFKGVEHVVISEYGYKEALQQALADTTIRKIYCIAGSDIFLEHHVSKPSHEKIAHLIITRNGFPVPPTASDCIVIPAEELSEQSYSSTAIRHYFEQRGCDDRSLPVTQSLIHLIRQRGLYQTTDAEFAITSILESAKKIVGEEIGAKKLIPLDGYPLSLRLAKDMQVSGLSGDVVFFVLDKEQHAQLAVKCFCGPSRTTHYESELKGFHKISQLHLKKVTVPKLYFSCQNTQFSLIAMSVAEGKRLTDLMVVSQEAVYICAEALLELHLAARSYATHLDHTWLHSFDERVQRVIERLRIGQGHFLSISASLVEARWSQVRSSFLANPGLCSFTHGDPNSGNWIVDMDKKRVTYIDLSLFSRSLSSEESPSGFAINEYYESLSSLWIVGERLGLSEEKIQELQKQFSSRYLSLAPADLATKEALVFFDTYWQLRGIYTLFKKLESQSGTQKSEIENQIAVRFAKLFR